MCKSRQILASALFLAICCAPAMAQQNNIASVSNVNFQEVKSTGFILDSRQQVTFEATLLKDSDNMMSPSSAWVIDGVTRKLVWASDVSEARKSTGPLVVQKESITLPAGPYEMYYASYIDWRETGRWKKVRGIADVVSTVLNDIFDNHRWNDWDDIDEQYEKYGDKLGLVVFGKNGRLERSPEALSSEFLATAFLTMTGIGDDAYAVEGFRVDREVDIEIYAIGEIEEEGRYDYGWIMDSESRDVVWSMDFSNTAPAGGAWKNRLSQSKLRLSPGSYAAFFVTDGSHSADEWNSPPPYDPDFWGISLKVLTPNNLSRIERVEYQNVDLDNAIVAIRKVRDDEHKSAGFSMSQAGAIRIYTVGEGSNNDMYDYAWIVDAATRKRVWTMEYRQTEHAGGSSKNRVFDGVITLPAGDYIVHYVSDGSHSYGDWNSDRPYDSEGWGVTILPATKDAKSIFEVYDEFSDTNVIARIAAVRDDSYKKQSFTLDQDTRIRIYALGEGSDGEMYDYGWIENSKSGKVVWEMTYRMSEHAGGSSKNRMVNNVIGLPAGNYTVYFQTDGSHAFGDWNSAPPSDPENWGMTVMRAE